MPYIDILVREKRAYSPDPPAIVCGNSDYIARFDFDEEWTEYETKTARFAYWKNGRTQHQDQVFTGSECPVPVLSGITQVLVGVFAGDLRTTTPAKVPCNLSILCGEGAPEAPPEDVYNQIMELLNAGGGSGGGTSAENG